jgi:hypothetical protein
MLASRTAAARLQALLVAAGTDALDRWYLGRGWPIQVMPAGKIVLADEDLDAGADGDVTFPRDRDHVLTLQLQCIAEDSDDPEADADTLAAQALLAVEGTAQPLADITAVATRIQRQLTTEGQARVAITTITLQLQFSTRSNDPTTII